MPYNIRKLLWLKGGGNSVCGGIPLRGTVPVFPPFCIKHCTCWNLFSIDGGKYNVLFVIALVHYVY